MTPPVALMANLAPAPSPSTNAPASDASSSASAASGNNFNAPLRQAHQQFARQTEASRPAPARQAQASSSSSSSSQADAKGKVGHKDKDNDTAASAAPGAAAAMLALLGQSVPASAAATDVSADDAGDATDAVGGTGTAAPLPASATISLLGAMQGAVQGQAGDANEFTKAMDGVQDKSLTMQGEDADDGDASIGQAATDSAATTKGDALGNALQALTSSSSSSSNSKDDSDPLEALKNLAASAMAQTPSSTVATTTPAAHVLTMQSSVGTPAFGQELSQQVTWLGGQDVKEARIRLHPEDLGELDVKVSVKQDHVDVAFIAQHPQAVHAVQQTLGQLDSMLAHHGLSLGQAMVGQGNSGQGSSAQSGGSSGSSGGESGLAEGVGELASVAAPIVKAVGLVDMFA